MDNNTVLTLDCQRFLLYNMYKSARYEMEVAEMSTIRVGHPEYLGVFFDNELDILAKDEALGFLFGGPAKLFPISLFECIYFPLHSFTLDLTFFDAFVVIAEFFKGIPATIVLYIGFSFYEFKTAF